MSDGTAESRQPDSGLQIGLVGWSSGVFGPAQLQQLRTDLRLPNGEPLPHAFTRHADGQTLTGLAVILQTLKQLPQPLPHADQWGVLAAPEYFGKEATLAALQRYSMEGPGAISPHLIPNHCLHSLAGSLSVLLQLHGPNYGIGGGPGQLTELLLAGILETVHSPVPGFWLVATAWRTLPTELGMTSESVPVCLALALAVCRSEQLQNQPRVSRHGPAIPLWGLLVWKSWPQLLTEPETTHPSQLQLESLLRALHTPSIPVGRSGEKTGFAPASAMVHRWHLPEVGVIELHKTHSAEATKATCQKEAA